MEETGLVFLPSPGVGHLISAVELAKRLLEKQPCFSITVLLMHPNIPSLKSPTAATTSYVKSVAVSSPNIRFIDLPLLDLPFENNQDPVTSFYLFTEKNKSHVKEAIKRTFSSSSSPRTRIAALIMDLFLTTMIDVGKELSIPTYIYFPSGANLLALKLIIEV